MPKQTRITLKGYFETGDTPSQAQYADLIDSNLNLSENNTGNIQLNGIYNGRILTGESTDSFNDINNPNRVTPKEVDLNFRNGIVTLPPHSLIIVHINSD